MNILILGRTEILYETARLLADNHNICGIITAKSVPEYSRDEEDFKKLAEELSCPYLFTETIGKEELDLIERVKPDICVSLNWVSILREEVISHIPRGVLNAHCGDLPRYRGNAVINWALLQHEPSITLSIHYMTAGELDSGPILVQENMQISGETTIKEILNFWKESTPGLFSKAIDGIEVGSIVPVDQASTGKQPFRCFPRLPVHSKIDWNSSAKDIHALVRASTHPYSGAYTYFRQNGRIRKLYIWSSRVVEENTADLGVPGHIIKNDAENGETHVFTGKGILAISYTQYSDESEEFMPGKVWKSIRMGFCIDIEEELIRLYDLAGSGGPRD